MTTQHSYVDSGYWNPGYTVGDGSALVPLQHSHAATDLEAELRDLFIQVFEQTLKAETDWINVYGAPHLGGVDLVTRNIEADGLSFIRTGDSQNLYYLLKSWKHLNPERGLHFLRLYIRTLFGIGGEVNQLWQKKSDPYPSTLKSRAEIESESDYFLTSRVRVDLDTDIVPERIVNSMRKAAPARFVLGVRVVKTMPETIGYAGVIRGASILRATGELELDSVYMTNVARLYGVVWASGEFTE